MSIKNLWMDTRNIIEKLEKEKNLWKLEELNIKKMKSEGKYYRIKVGEYRIGLELEGERLIFVRILNRKDIYKYFP